VNCYLYEWPGFHFSTGTPSEEGVLDAGEAAWDYLTALPNSAQRGIILMGHSLGSGPCVTLATSDHVRQSGRLAAVVMRAPVTSMCAICCPCPRLCCCCPSGAHRACCSCFGQREVAQCCDSFRNIDKISDVSVPVFLMHSKADEVVPFEHSERLRDLCVGKVTLWVLETRRHADLPRFDPFAAKFGQFLLEVSAEYKASITTQQVGGDLDVDMVDLGVAGTQAYQEVAQRGQSEDPVGYGATSSDSLLEHTKQTTRPLAGKQP